MFELSGVPVLERVLMELAAAGAQRPVVVGPHRAGLRGDYAEAREDPPGSGPLAALGAGLVALSGVGSLPGEALDDAADPAEHMVFVLAGDLPYLTAASLESLVAALAGEPGRDCALAVDAEGNAQYLLGVWWLASMQRALRELGDLSGRAVAALFDRVEPVLVELQGGASGQEPWRDLDRRPKVG